MTTPMTNEYKAVLALSAALGATVGALIKLKLAEKRSIKDIKSQITILETMTEVIVDLNGKNAIDWNQIDPALQDKVISLNVFIDNDLM